MQPIFIRVVFPDSFSTLQQMLDLGLIKIRITFNHELIKQLTTFLNAHLCLVQLAIFLSHLLHLNRLSLLMRTNTKPKCNAHSIPGASQKQLTTNKLEHLTYKFTSLMNVVHPIELFNRVFPL